MPRRYKLETPRHGYMVRMDERLFAEIKKTAADKGISINVLILTILSASFDEPLR